MKNRRTWIRGITAACAMLVMILDTRTAILSAREGVTLCIRTVVPSLFPFFVLSGVINSCLLGRRLRYLEPLGRFCRIPQGTESLLLLGFLAGYPIGAQLITQAYKDDKLTANSARRMLGFCNNAGPAFLFGMLSPLFASAKTVWALWAIHIFSALITGCSLPADMKNTARISPGSGISFAESLTKAVKAITAVCGWVILFRVILGFCSRWFLWLFPSTMQVLISGLLELANGCVLLQNISQEGMRFLLAGTMLSFGGLCVGMQTMSVTEGIGTGWYFPGKVLQTTLTALISVLLQPVLFANSEAVTLPIFALIGLAFAFFLLLFIFRRKKVVAFSTRLLYNTGNERSKGANYAVSQEDYAVV